MISKVYIVTDLGPGDGGKGGVVDCLCARFHPSLVIKEGGAQGSHGVVLESGEKFAFSQWGCGTFYAIPSYLSPRMVIAPISLQFEDRLLSTRGIADPYELLIASPDCICATPYHRYWSQLHEMLLRDQPHGTVGTGVGKAYLQAQSDPDMTIFAADLTNRELMWHKLAKQRSFVAEQLFTGITPDQVLPQDREYLEVLKKSVVEMDTLYGCIELFFQVGQKLRLASYDEVLRGHGGIAVVERSHGVLTDHEAGIKPHVSELSTLPKHSSDALKSAGFTGQLVQLAAHRAYAIRHGAGPLPTHDAALQAELLPGSHKDANRWQGEVRVGALDLNLLRFALQACHDTPFDGLCLTWFDQILKANKWRICTSYQQGVVWDSADLAIQLQNVTPVYQDFPIMGATQQPEQAFAACSEILNCFSDIPKLRMLSLGATASAKYLK